MKALILAAGRGVRMGELTAERPKPMVEILGKPMLERIMLNLKAAGAGEFYIVTGYRADVIESYFGDGSNWGLKIHYLRQEVQDGNARAIGLARKVIGGDPFFLACGDIMMHPANYKRVREEYTRHPSDLQLTVVELEDVSAGSSVVFDATGLVTEIEEKPAPGTEKSKWNSAALFISRPSIFSYLAKVPKSPRGEYELTDAIQAMIADPQCLVRAVKLQGYWGDIRNADELARMEETMRGDSKL
jgi:dTDP-glucose pyrophosphorylase